MAVEECVNARYTISAINLSCFGGFRSPADDPLKPWRRWVRFLGTTGLAVGLHYQEATMLGGIGMPELLIILVIVLIIFGASKLPQIGEGLGKGIRSFKKNVSSKEEIDVTPKKSEEIAGKSDESKAISSKS